MRSNARGTRWLLSVLALVVLAVPCTYAAHAHHHHHLSPARQDPIINSRLQQNSEFVKGKICIGTNGRMSVPSTRENHYRNLRDRFTNCTYVDGNLELTWLENATQDLSFLQYIREVTGYVLISHVNVRRIVLPQLQIIRGRNLFKLNVRDEEFALLVMMSGAYSLELPALRDVLSGSVGIYKNFNLCHVKTINWAEIITGPAAKYVYVYNFATNERECPACDKSCDAGCWGDGPENCQKFSKTNCSPQCSQGRCFGPNPRECCHLFCAGGCNGPKQSDCLACRNFYDDGLCTLECPPMQRYNPDTYSWEENPNGKYAYGATCVRNCPEHLLKDNGACVRSCPAKKTAVNGECIPCNVTCPKTCAAERPIHAGNIDSFKDCTIIDGSIEILEQSFTGYQQVYTNFSFGPRYPKMHPDRLEVFNTLTEVTGYINIQGYHEEFTNLSYFRNLEVIGGRQLMENFFASLYIVKTALKSLELKSLKKINSGSVIILENKQLCFAQQVSWTKIKKSSEHRDLLQNNNDEKECKKQGLVCDPQCTAEGCWGGGPDQCLSCQNFQFHDICLGNCNSSGMYQASPTICKSCHKECGPVCDGPGPEHCSTCKHARDGPFCVPKCPSTKYESDNGTCVSCHDNCVKGCTGPLNTIGPGACNSCEKAVISSDVTVERCLQKNESCPDGFYYEWLGPSEQGPLKPLAEKTICRKCHPRCKKCTGYGFHEQVCQECSKFKRGELCEDECPSDHYADAATHTCQPCHVECRGCSGAGPENCLKCRNFKIFLDGPPSSDNTTAFNCTTSCPADLPHKIFPNEQSIDPYCFSEPVGSVFASTDAATTSTILTGVLVMAFVVLVFLGIIGYICKQKAKAKKDAVKMTMVLTGCEDNEPLRPTNVKPNLAKLRIVKEAELRKGGILGFGAFGKVFKGVWVPEGENVKIPVAIKVLREGTGANTSKEFLEEAYIMASVEHPNLLQLLAVCMTSQMMLITQLMPLGCLLDYVRNHKEKIGSKALLNWCTQIARGMAYLEEKRLVHRDLAARNVLVQTPNCIKITDFGLAKLLDINEDEYKAAGGKMPIKWLALECIQHRIFTHKSDVWAFGVTIWELLTYGGRPYENISARNVPELIENGLKLPQPAICTLDIYCIMVSCWMLDADSRPPFKQLAETFAEMALDPGRYLVIPGDKFMRLPSYSHQVCQDEKELIRTLSSAMEGTESFMEADEYLQPSLKGAQGVITTGTNSMVSGGGDCASVCVGPSSSGTWPTTCTGAEAMSESTSRGGELWDKELLHYARRAGVDLNDARHYCNGGLTADGPDVPNTTKVIEAQVGNLKLDLPLDEDDYLMPSPQQNRGASTYMDLIGETSNENKDEKTAEMPNLRSFNSFAGKTCVDNPEYLMQVAEDENMPTQTVGIPTSDVPQEESKPTLVTDVTQPVALTPQRSVEEESMSDHEYYNDLQREMQPLRRNETTV